MRSAIETSSRPCSSAKARRSGTRAMPPESSTTSHSTPTGARPARRARSTDASVCPARLSVPPGRARSGKMWPGRLKAPGPTVWSASARRVRARSAAEIPVEVPSARSTVTVKAVPCTSVFPLAGTISGRCSSSHRSPVMPTQITPEVWRTKKAICSSVARSAAMIRSPSFSRSSSSATTTISPRAMAAIAASMGSNTGRFTPSPPSPGARSARPSVLLHRPMR